MNIFAETLQPMPIIFCRKSGLIFISNFYLTISLLFLFSILTNSCKNIKDRFPKKIKSNDLQAVINQESHLLFDSTALIRFFETYPELKKYEPDAFSIYREHHFNQIWFDSKGVVEFGYSLFSKASNLETEGISSKFPYQDKLIGVFETDTKNELNNIETEIMLTSLFLFYAEKVYKGIDETTTTTMGWLLPRKQLSYRYLLDSIFSDTTLLNQDNRVLIGQYYKLRTVLMQYREIEKKGGWNTIDVEPKQKAFKPGDTARTIRQIREHLYITGDLKHNDSSNLYDTELLRAVKSFQRRNGKTPDKLISLKLIKEMNVPIGERIKQIMLNMERCRWISPETAEANEVIVVNIPSYKLNYFRNGKSVLESAVVVGKNMSKTVIFGGKMSYIVFSPYWNVPQSIINKEVKPGIAKNPNYLLEHNMEWNNGLLRQKPGRKNSLGLVKFIFPNSNDIYLHDTPSKGLFERDSRAFSHGCVRVGKARELAINILQDDPSWTPQKIDTAMHAGVERSYTLKKKIPVYIGYFTAWVNDEGEIYFYEDIYERDDNLAQLLFGK
jgi:murein L,D-transpeptidase YcbB/YkuD